MVTACLPCVPVKSLVPTFHWVTPKNFASAALLQEKRERGAIKPFLVGWLFGSILVA